MFIVITNQVLKMGLLMLVGLICAKSGLVSEEGNKTLSNLLLLVVNPLMIFQSFLMERTPALVHSFFISAIVSAGIFAFTILITRLVFSREGNPGYAVERFSVIYSNCGFFGIPLIGPVLGGKGIFYLTPFMAVFNILVWTQGLFLMTGKADRTQLRKGLTSPVIFCIIFGLICFLGNIRLPGVVTDSLSYISNMNTPMAMLIAGIALARSDIRAVVRNQRLYLVAAVKLLLVPGILLVLLALLNKACTGRVDPNVFRVLLIAAACPAAASGTMMALRYHNNYQYASEIFAFTTLAAMVTTPAIVFAMEHLI